MMMNKLLDDDLAAYRNDPNALSSFSMSPSPQSAKSTNETWHSTHLRQHRRLSNQYEEEQRQLNVLSNKCRHARWRSIVSSVTHNTSSTAESSATSWQQVQTGAFREQRQEDDDDDKDDQSMSVQPHRPPPPHDHFGGDDDDSNGSFGLDQDDEEDTADAPPIKVLHVVDAKGDGEVMEWRRQSLRKHNRRRSSGVMGNELGLHQDAALHQSWSSVRSELDATLHTPTQHSQRRRRGSAHAIMVRRRSPNSVVDDGMTSRHNRRHGSHRARNDDDDDSWCARRAKMLSPNSPKKDPLHALLMKQQQHEKKGLQSGCTYNHSNTSERRRCHHQRKDTKEDLILVLPSMPRL